MAENSPKQSSEHKAVPLSAAATTTIADPLHAAADPALTEDLALALLNHADLPTEALEQLAKNANALKSRKVKIALTGHPKTPRHVSVPLARQLYTFDLMKVALSVGVPADVRVAADDVLIARLKTITVGERLTLARRASARVAAALLLDAETRIMRAALDNPRLTESLVIHSVLRPAVSAVLVQAVAHHAKWSSRREIRTALLRTEHLSLARALEFSREIPAPLLQELLGHSRLAAFIKNQLILESRSRQTPQSEDSQ